jgi:Xaa-Pro aminopeptidase
MRHAMGTIPTFSWDERERRWGRLRALMAPAQLDAIVAVPNSGHWDQFQADVRYLTQIGGNGTEAAVVFPLAGEVVAILRGENDIAWWGLEQDWVEDLRPSRRAYATPIAERLRELGLARGRIGIAGLAGLVRAPEGVVPWGLLEGLRAALPDAAFVDATAVMQTARATKSSEEVAFIRRAAGVAEAAVRRMLALARPGVAERQVYAAMVETMLAAGGEFPTMILWGAGRQPPWPHRMLTDRVLQAGDVINNEIEGRWAGYIAQVVAPCTLGPAEAASREIFALSVQLFEDLRTFMRPGVSFTAVWDRYRSSVTAAGYEPGAALFHGRGLGEDRPLVWGHRPPEGEELVLAEGMVFILKPAVFPPGGRDVVARDGEIVELALRTGDTVVVTARGAERLGERALELVELGK